MTPRHALALATAAAIPLLARSGPPSFPDIPPPHAFGRVVLDNYSTAAGVPPVTFEHWRHRSLYSCRVCHVDVGFAMERLASEISRGTNAAHLHCGACHNGTTLSRGKAIFPACSPEGPFRAETCGSCHSVLLGSKRRSRYAEITKGLPVYAGGYVDWYVAEGRGDILPQDYVEGVSIPRDRLKIDRDIPIETKGTWLGKVTFSHRKHAAWNGCELCHPEIFPSTMRGSVSFTMDDVNAGKYCGVCHRTVASPIAECTRCHDAEPGKDGSQSSSRSGRSSGER